MLGINFLSFNAGYGIGVTSPMIAQLTEQFLGDGRASWFASSLVIGQIFGSFLGSFFANRLGRKKICVIAALFSCAGKIEQDQKLLRCNN